MSFRMISYAVIGALFPLPLMAQGMQDLRESDVPAQCTTSVAHDGGRALDQYIATLASDVNAPAIGVAVVSSGGVLWQGAYGQADIANGRAVNVDTPFGLASVSKTFIGMAIAHAVENGHVNLDRPINDYLPFQVDNPHVSGEVITLRHLATHTSGIIDSPAVYDTVKGDHPTPLGTFLRGYLTPGGETYDRRKNFARLRPGRQFIYSNAGASLAGYVLERATGMGLDEYTQRHIFAPLGMKNTAWFLRDLKGVAPVVQYNTSGAVPEPYPHYGIISWPDGQLRSSTHDMARYLAAILDQGGSALSPHATRFMFSKQIDVDGAAEGFAHMGLFWPTMLDGSHTHTGGYFGVVTIAALIPADDLGFVFFANSETPNGKIAQQIMACLYQQGLAQKGKD